MIQGGDSSRRDKINPMYYKKSSVSCFVMKRDLVLERDNRLLWEKTKHFAAPL